MGRVKYARFGKPENKEIEEEYIRRLRESEGFDLSGVKIPLGAPVVPCVMEGPYYSFNVAVNLYARLGLHRYNMLLGGDLKLLDIKSINRRSHVPSSFYITLDAFDSAAAIDKVFQVKVHEMALGYLNCRCTIARPQVTNKIPNEARPLMKNPDQSLSDFYDTDMSSLPEWPSSEDAFNDTSRFYVVKESEFEDHSWIRLYLELAIASNSRTNDKDTLSHLKIVKVVIETKEAVELPNERLNAKCATLYIRYKNTARKKVGKGTNRLAIVRRDFHETTGYMMLLGKTWTLDTNEQHPQKRAKTDVGVRRLSTRIRKPIERFGS